MDHLSRGTRCTQDIFAFIPEQSAQPMIQAYSLFSAKMYTLHFLACGEIW